MMNSNRPSHLILCLPESGKVDPGRPIHLSNTHILNVTRNPSGRRIARVVILTLEFTFISVLSLAFNSAIHTFPPSRSHQFEGCALHKKQAAWLDEAQIWLMYYAWGKLASGAFILNHGLPCRRGWFRISNLEYLVGSTLITVFGFVGLLIHGILSPIFPAEGGLVLRMTETMLSTTVSLLAIALPGCCVVSAFEALIQEFDRGSSNRTPSGARSASWDATYDADSLCLDPASPDSLPPYQV